MGVHIEKIEAAVGDFSIHVDLSIQRGEMLALLGPSGCGKTTCLKTIAGFIPLKSGKILLNNVDIAALPAHKRNIGFVFQDYALFPHMNVQGNISYGPKAKNWSKERINKTVDELLQLIRLGGSRTRRIDELSGGERQRVALARALASDPYLLLLDEPLSALDAKLRKTVRKEIRRIQQELNITSIYVTHDQEEALTIADRIAVMKDGRIIQTGTPKELYEKPATLFIGEFIGESNYFTGMVEKIESDTALVACNSVIFSTRYGDNIEEGQKVYLFFRPENCLPSGTLTDPPNSFKATITNLEYYGSYSIVEGKTDLGDEPVKIQLSSSSSIKIGDTCSFYINPERLWVLS
ncbi:MAG: ABC transporter ATP-binding protein [Spirochaetota bacterium]